MSLRAAILSTGDELTSGRITDTNAGWIADKLFEIGVDVACILAVGDDPERLAWAWRQALERAEGRLPKLPIDLAPDVADRTAAV